MKQQQTSIFILHLPKCTDLYALDTWLKHELGDNDTPVDVLYDLENDCWHSVYLWMWLTDKNLNNLFPCCKIGFLHEKDALLCKLIWG